MARKHHRHGHGRKGSRSMVSIEPRVPSAPQPMIPNPVYMLEKGRTPIGPILLERVCDFEKPMLTVEEVSARYQGGPANWGCGIRFRWYFGMQCICPGCGHTYQYIMEMLHEKKFLVSS